MVPHEVSSFFSYEVQVSVSDVTATNVEVNVSVSLYHVNRRDVTHATPMDLAITPTNFVKKDEVRTRIIT